MTKNNCLHGHRSELSLCDLGTWDWALWSRSTPHPDHLALTLAVSTLRAASALITMRGISGVDTVQIMLTIATTDNCLCVILRNCKAAQFRSLKFELLDSNVRITTFIDAKVGVVECWRRGRLRYDQCYDLRYDDLQLCLDSKVVTLQPGQACIDTVHCLGLPSQQLLS